MRGAGVAAPWFCTRLVLLASLGILHVPSVAYADGCTDGFLVWDSMQPARDDVFRTLSSPKNTVGGILWNTGRGLQICRCYPDRRNIARRYLNQMDVPQNRFTHHTELKAL